MRRSLAGLGLCVYIAASCLLAYFFPQSVLAFFLVEASLLLLYYIDAPRQIKIFLGVLVLVMLFPILGWANGYYLEIAIQIGIFVALALGLNIVVGFVGLLNLGFVAFYAIGAYLWAIFGSPQANAFIPGRPVSAVAQLVFCLSRLKYCRRRVDRCLSWACRFCACAATISPSSLWASPRSCAR